MTQWDGSINDLVHNGYDRSLAEASSPQPFNCTTCGEEAWTGMTIFAYGCRRVFLYHPAEIEIEVLEQDVPIVGYNTSCVADTATDADWVVKKDTDFVYNPGGTALVVDTPAELERTIGALVRGLTKIVVWKPYLGERDMGAMRGMIKKEVIHRIKWRDDDPEYRLRKASNRAFLAWSGGILKGPWVPHGTRR